jgi:HD-GYP domain-containing protein (c-di-GMP phosphodiesterase class II)
MFHLPAESRIPLVFPKFWAQVPRIKEVGMDDQSGFTHHEKPMNDHTAIEQAKRFVVKHFERLLALLLVAATLLIHFFIEYKLAFLSFYYLPVIAAGFLVGRTMAVWAAVFVVALVAYVQATIGLMGVAGIGADELMHLMPWGGFMILTGYVVGTLADQRKARTDDVRMTYLTMLELLTLHVDSGDRMRRGHSYRVGERAVLLGRELGLTDSQQEDLRVSGLLHEIGPRDPRLVRVMSDMPTSKDSKVSSMRKALRLVDEYGHYHEVVSTGWPVDDTRITIGAKILAVADAYETLQTPTPTRQAFAPWTALEEIERGTGTTFASEVVRALRKTASMERVEQHSDDRAIRLA